MNTAWTKLALLGALGLGSLGVGGCVAQTELDQMRRAYRNSLDQQEALKANLEEAEARIKALQEMQRGNDPEMASRLDQAIAERNKLADALRDAEGKLRNAGSIGDLPALPTELNEALQALAQSDPELMEYDPAAGMVRFRSDLTFPTGSTQVSPEAIGSLNKLAEILRRPIAQRYESRIVGHTDNLRIGRADTRAQHPTNWHLSVHRSIAVKDVLEKAGVPPVRISVAGYGEYHPVVANGARGAAQNRRVEIYLVPSTYTGPTGAAAPEPAPLPPRETPARSTPAPTPRDDTPPEMFK